MSNFSQDIQNFCRYGEYTYKFDENGNLIFNNSSMDFSQVYLSLPLKNIVYNNSKLISFYPLDFVEFVSTTNSEINQTPSEIILQQQLDTAQSENSLLKSQLDSVISQNENNETTADQLSIKQVILELRKSLGQGRVDSDFSTTFPYTAITKPIT